MWIDVKIPYEPGKRLAEAYNRAMENTSAEWVLLLDHDVSFVNPHWYDMSLEAVMQLQNTDAGLITCVTSGKARSPQQVYIENSNDIETQESIALYVYRKHRDEVVKKINITITGFFMLIRKEAWKNVQFKGNGLDKIDIDFSKRLMESGYSIWLIPGLYVYHRRGLRNLKFE